MSNPSIPIIDIFAGPGGLGEGFTSVRRADADVFKIALSIEKDIAAHETLELRAFRRAANSEAAKAYFQTLAKGLKKTDLFSDYPDIAKRAGAEAWKAELGEISIDTVRDRVDRALGKAKDWVLIGGPPCQAYSLAGRSRNSGKQDYDPNKDVRQRLYIEYLQILADHRPPVFLMENVKGLLSASLDGKLIFDRIRDDLGDPRKALLREGRRSRTHSPHYDLYALADYGEFNDGDARTFTIKSELHGLPQARHRVILLGLRRDYFSSPKLGSLTQKDAISVGSAIMDLPRVRSGISRDKDSAQYWLEHLRSARRLSWVTQLDKDTRHALTKTIDNLSAPVKNRGAESIEIGGGEVVWNHSARGHMKSDLHRYLFAASYAEAHGRSPHLKDFPVELLPLHGNVDDKKLADCSFSDRFRVQLKNRPSTTITSHIAKDGHYYIHPDPTQCRSLTVREAARLQTFPDDYFFCGNRTEQYGQVGNAVPPLLGKKVATIVAKLFE